MQIKAANRKVYLPTRLVASLFLEGSQMEMSLLDVVVVEVGINR